jgi:hypothetical protein
MADQKIVTIIKNTQQREYQHTCTKEIFGLHISYVSSHYKLHNPTAALHPQYEKLFIADQSPHISMRHALVTPTKQLRNVYHDGNTKINPTYFIQFN